MKYLFQHIKIRLGIALFGLLLATRLLALEMSIIPLLNADAEQILPAIEQQLGEGSSASAYQNQIILNATAEETRQVKVLLATLDSAGRQLRIAVKTGSTGSVTTSGGSISNTGMDDSGIRISTNGRHKGTTTTIQRRTTTSTGSAQQGIRATEGQPAYITTGTSMAYNQPAMTSNGQIVQTRQWQDAKTGFWATARVNGETVSIELEQQQESFNSNTIINSQQLQTHVNGRLGEWIAVGTLHSQDNSTTRSLNSSQHSNNNQSGTIYLKVELAE